MGTAIIHMTSKDHLGVVHLELELESLLALLRADSVQTLEVLVECLLKLAVS